MNNDFFTPTAQPTKVVTNFENGQAFSAMDVFRNLFNSSAVSLKHFSKKEDEWDAQNCMKEEINHMIFGTYYSVGSKGTEPTQEQIEAFKTQAIEMTEYMLWNEDSPLQRFKKEYRKFFTKKLGDAERAGGVVEYKTLNVDKVEEFFDIGLTKAARRYATSFALAGESQDWYINEIEGGGINSTCFEETQLLVVARWIKKALNVYGDHIELAETRLSEGRDAQEVREDISRRVLHIEEIVEDVMQNAKTEVRRVYVYKSYGDWVVDYTETARRIDANSAIYEAESYMDGRKFANSLNEEKAATKRLNSNLEEIENIKARLLELQGETEGRENDVDDALKEVIECEDLAQFLQIKD